MLDIEQNRRAGKYSSGDILLMLSSCSISIASGTPHSQFRSTLTLKGLLMDGSWIQWNIISVHRKGSRVCQIDDRSGATSAKYMMSFGVRQS